MTTTPDITYINYEPGSEQLIQTLVDEHLGWATSIAKSVAKAWNMDWQLDGLDGGAFDGLLFCARRYDPKRGVPFKAYARKRIHEGATQEARKSRGWQMSVSANGDSENVAREISAKMFEVFPELREGLFATTEGDDGDSSIRSSVRQLLTGASLIALFREAGVGSPELAFEHKLLIQAISSMEPIHQQILFSIYWQGQSMRNLAEEWSLDDLSIIREHKEILEYLNDIMSEKKRFGTVKQLKVRRGLKDVAQKMKKKNEAGPFSSIFKATLIVSIFVKLCYSLV